MYNILYPESTTTQRHIVNYDQLQIPETELPLKYFAFPQKGVTICILKNAVIESEGHHLTISKGVDEQPKVVFLGKYVHPLMITYKDAVEEIAINFNETGIHYFFPDLWSGGKLVSILDGAAMNLDTEQLFNGNDKLSLTYLEDYLIGRYAGLEISGIEKVIWMINNDPGHAVAQLAEQVFLTEKTLNRQFQKYVGCTISKYRSIVRFRNTIETHFKNSNLSLTELCLENDYFDSPHFYKQMKKIAHFNPKDFFNKVRANGLGSYPYIFD